MHARPHEKLLAWTAAYRLSLAAYQHTKSFPASELYGMTSQIRRAAVSAPLNIAEGNAKTSLKERRHFFEIASASLEELHCCFRLASDLEYISTQLFMELDEKMQHTSKLIIALIRSLR